MAAGFKSGGRQKGSLNKDNADIRAMIIGALSKVGGVDYLAARAIDTPTAFMGLVGKVLPLQLAGHDGGKLVVDFRWADAPPVIDAVADETKASVEIDAADVAFIGEC